MKEDYVRQIIELLNKCNDLSLLDLVLKILQKTLQ